MDDRPQPGRGIQDGLREQRRTPAGEEDLGIGEGGGDLRGRVGQPVGDEIRIGADEAGQPAALPGGEQPSAPMPAYSRELPYQRN